MMQTTEGQRLREARKALGLSMRDFAAPLELSHQAISHYEKGESPIKETQAYAIQKQHSISVDWLLTGDGEMFVGSKPVKGVAETPVVYGDDCNQGSHLVVLKVSSRPAAGDGNALEDYVIETGKACFDYQWLRRTFNVQPEYLYLMDVDGESMQPTLQHNETIFVDASDSQDFSRDGIWVLSVRQKLYVKRVTSVGSIFRATSDNPLYSPLELDETAKLMGRVVGRATCFF